MAAATAPASWADGQVLALVASRLPLAQLCDCLRVCGPWRRWLLRHPEVSKPSGLGLG